MKVEHTPTGMPIVFGDHVPKRNDEGKLAMFRLLLDGRHVLYAHTSLRARFMYDHAVLGNKKRKQRRNKKKANR